MSNSQASQAKQGMEKYFFRASAADFKKIPGSPIAYWVGAGILDAFERAKTLGELAEVKHGLSTGKNAEVVRLWSEISRSDFGLNLSSREKALSSGKKWFPYNKGGDFRKWFGNCEFVLRYDEYGNSLMESFPGHRHDGKSHYFLEGVTWTFISSTNFAARYTPPGFIFDVSGSSLFIDNPKETTGYLCSNLSYTILKALNPTLNFQVGNLKSLPILENELQSKSDELRRVSHAAIAFSTDDWNSFETSWDFTSLPLLHFDHRQNDLKTSYQKLRIHWRHMALEMQRLEQENNCIFIDAYGLQEELTPEVPLSEITLTCNPHYRYGGDKTEEELEAMLLADTMRELVSYAVGCMLGRYSLDKPGLILANQGETLADYLAQVPQPSFPADDDNVIPVLDGDWFADDITLRFRQFLRVALGEEHYDENLAFIEQALNVKGKRYYGLRDYFLSEFYADHVKRYKKRPIYWLFSSPKGSFNALIYMHRYRPDTVSVVLKYLRDYREKLTTERQRQLAASINPATSQGDKTRAIKEAERLAKVLTELDDYERDTLYPLATEQLQIDLDDGVKVNYLKFGAALKKIVGLDAKGED